MKGECLDIVQNFTYFGIDLPTWVTIVEDDQGSYLEFDPKYDFVGY